MMDIPPPSSKQGSNWHPPRRRALPGVLTLLLSLTSITATETPHRRLLDGPAAGEVLLPPWHPAHFRRRAGTAVVARAEEEKTGAAVATTSETAAEPSLVTPTSLVPETVERVEEEEGAADVVEVAATTSVATQAAAEEVVVWREEAEQQAISLTVEQQPALLIPSSPPSTPLHPAVSPRRPPPPPAPPPPLNTAPPLDVPPSPLAFPPAPTLARLTLTRATGVAATPPADDGRVAVTVAIHAAQKPSLAVSAMVFKWFVSSDSSLLSPEVRLSDGGGASTTQATYRVVFTPPAAGTYYVAARLEYTSRERALMDPTCSPGGDVNCFNIGGDKRPEPYRGVQLDGSPLTVAVTQDQLSSAERPWCHGSLHRGVWKDPSAGQETPGSASESQLTAAFLPKADFADSSQRSCQVCKGLDEQKLSPNDRERIHFLCRRKEGGLRLQHTELTLYDGQRCRYCRFDRPQAVRCLRRKRITFVGDSVTMDLCNHMRCALATAEGAGRCVTGYDVRGCGALNPTRKAHVCDEDGRVGDPKLRSNLMCVSWDHFMANTNAARTINVFTQMTKHAGDERNLTARMRGYREGVHRLYNGTRSEGGLEGLVEEGDIEDVLVLGAGQHDAGYSSLNFKHMAVEIRRVFDAAHAAGWERVVWQLAGAVQKSVPFFADCSNEPQHYHMVGMTCEQTSHFFLTPPRLEAFNEFVLKLVKEYNTETKRTIEVLDAFELTNMREDTTGHRDPIHYCPVVYHNMAQLLMHQLCGCQGGV